MNISDKKIKVCHLTSAHKANDIRIFHKEACSLASSGLFEVYLIAVNAEEKQINNVNVVSAKTKSTSRLLRILNHSKAVYKKALEIDAEIYHFHDPELLPYGLKLQRKGKIVIYDSHEDVPRQILGKHWIPSILRKTIATIYEKYEDYVSSKLSFIVVSTPTIKNRFSKVNIQCEAICNYPILKENIEIPSWTNRGNSICYIGGITKIRGIVQLVNSLKLMPNVRLNLAGAFSPTSLKNELQEIESWSNVDDLGYVNRDEIIEILNKSKVGMVTLLPQENYIDSLPIKMFEYMYAGIPVVASNFPLWESIVNENQCGVCVDPYNEEEIAIKTLELLKDDDKAEKMGKNGREAVIKYFNWENEEKKLIEIYLKLSKN